MGRSYTYTWEGHYKERDDDKEGRCHLVFGMTISEMIKTLINLYDGKVSQFTVKIHHQTKPMCHPVRELRVLKDFDWNDEEKGIHDIYRDMGLDYNKPIPRRYYELKTLTI